MANTLSKQLSVSIAANTTNPSLFGQTRFEYASVNGFLNIYLNGSALGLTARLIIGSNEVIESSQVNAQNRMPVVPDDLLFGGIQVRAGQRITLEVSNTTAGALTAFARLEMESAQGWVG